jgi:hypothetical protein
VHGQAAGADILEVGLAEMEIAIAQHAPGNPQEARMPLLLAPVNFLGLEGGHGKPHWGEYEVRDPQG